MLIRWGEKETEKKKKEIAESFVTSIFDDSKIQDVFMKWVLH